jgi:hypothetical protein
LLISRCGAHTLELLLSDVLNVLPEINNAIKICKEVIIVIKNNKDALHTLYSIQKALAPNKVPYSLILPANTRKWFGSYLMVSRVLKLRTVVNTVVAQFNFTQLDWKSLEISQDILYQFFWREQVLQSNASSALHVSNLWNSLQVLIQNMIEKLPSSTSKELFLSKVEKQDNRISSSGYIITYIN